MISIFPFDFSYFFLSAVPQRGSFLGQYAYTVTRTSCWYFSICLLYLHTFPIIFCDALCFSYICFLYFSRTSPIFLLVSWIVLLVELSYFFRWIFLIFLETYVLNSYGFNIVVHLLRFFYQRCHSVAHSLANTPTQKHAPPAILFRIISCILTYTSFFYHITLTLFQ